VRKEILAIILVVTLSTLAVWLPFALKPGWFLGLTIPKEGMQIVMRNYDGPNYLAIVKCSYQKDCIGSHFSLPSSLEYYPAHFPGYPLTICFLDVFLPTTWAMLMATFILTVAAAIMFYLLLKEFKLTTSPLWLTILFLFLPARFWIIRTIGSPEPLFILAILASVYFFKKNNYWLAGIFGGLAQITKTPGILLFIAYSLWLMANFLKTKKRPWKAYPLLLIPLSVFLVFYFYKIQTGDFWAYFHSGDNFHLVSLPFQTFVSERSWLGDIWVEDVVWLYLLGIIGLILLYKKKLHFLFTFAAIFFSATLFVAHRDVTRYSLPLTPFLLIGYEKFLNRKEFKIALAVIFLGIYLYTLNFIIHNTAPVADWAPYL
jgi:hypothetical protein